MSSIRALLSCALACLSTGCGARSHDLGDDDDIRGGDADAGDGEGEGEAEGEGEGEGEGERVWFEIGEIDSAECQKGVAACEGIAFHPSRFPSSGSCDPFQFRLTVESCGTLQPDRLVRLYVRRDDPDEGAVVVEIWFPVPAQYHEQWIAFEVPASAIVDAGDGPFTGYLYVVPDPLNEVAECDAEDEAVELGRAECGDG